MSSISHLLLSYLDELLQEEFERFKSFLTKNMAQGFASISRSRLENANQNKVVELMVDQYNESDAAKITVQILREINQNKLASDLDTKLMKLKVTETDSERKSKASSDPDSVRKAAVFVDKYRPDLIQKVKSVMQIADALLTKEIITSEAYSDINQEAIPQNQMRKMYKFLTTRIAKEEFYNLLKKVEPYLVTELQETL